jgi:peptidylprolyl isomerase
MARSASPTSNGSQFYLTLAPTPNLDGQYTVFGRVLGVADLGVLDRVARGEPPATPTRITSVTILVGAR